MGRAAGSVVLGLSACGYPLTQFAVRRCGVPGAAVAEAVCAGLAIRDASLVASGLPGRLRPVPAALSPWPNWSTICGMPGSARRAMISARVGGDSIRYADPPGLPPMLGWLIRRIWAARVSRTDGITAMHQVSRAAAAGAAARALLVPCLCRGCSDA
jgi:hypothetical protein